MSGVKGLIVDFGGVLTNNLRGVMRDFCRAEGLADDALFTLFAVDPQARAVFADLERGAMTQPAWEREAARMLGVPAENLLRRALATMRPAEAMLDVVERARRAGYATACLTNSYGLEPFDPYAPWKLNERFDVVVISELEHLRKPDIEIYRRTLDRLNLPGEECLFLDDIEANLVPAAELGMTVLHVTDPTTAAPEAANLLRLPA